MSVDMSVGTLIGMLICMLIGMSVSMSAGMSVGISVGMSVGMSIGKSVGMSVDMSVGMLVDMSVGQAQSVILICYTYCATFIDIKNMSKGGDIRCFLKSIAAPPYHHQPPAPCVAHSFVSRGALSENKQIPGRFFPQRSKTPSSDDYMYSSKNSLNVKSASTLTLRLLCNYYTG